MITSLPRRRFIQGSALVAALGAAASCSKSDSGQGGGATADFSGTGPITWVQGKDFSSGMVQAHIDEWNSENPDEQVTLVELSSEADQQRQSLINNAQTQSDAYDVISVDVVWVAEFAANQWILELPMDELKNDDIIQPVWDAGCYMDKLYAMPYATDAPLMYYRKDFLTEAGVEVPTTWDEIKSAVDAVRQVSGHEEIGGFGGQFAKYEGLTCCSSEFIHTAGGDFFDDQNQVVVNSPESIEGLQNIMDGFKNGYIPQAALEWKEEDGRNAFEKGDVLFYRQWPYQYANNLENLGDDKFGVAALPSLNGKTFISALGGHYCGVSAFSKNKETALKFIKWWTAKESELYMLDKQSNAPILGSLYEDADMLQKYPYLPTLRSSLDAARARPKAVAYGDVTAAIQDAVFPAIQQQTTAEDAISGLENKLKELSD